MFEKIKTMPVTDKIILLSSAGTLFALYLSSVKFFTQGCSVLSSCSYFMGIPSCYFGLLFFTLSLLSSVAFKFCLWGGKTMRTARLHLLRTSSVLGLLFALYFSFVEIKEILEGTRQIGLLILPSCTYGAVVFAFVAYLAFKIENKSTQLKDSAEKEQNDENPHIA